eukprot:7331091-Pyramimonas_sp.AAC.1
MSDSHLAEHHVLAVEPGRGCRAQKKLASVGVTTRIGHGQDARPRVAQLKVLVGELLSVDRSSSWCMKRATSLPHILWMKCSTVLDALSGVSIDENQTKRVQLITP